MVALIIQINPKAATTLFYFFITLSLLMGLDLEIVYVVAVSSPN